MEPEERSKALSEAGRRGGQAKVRKGFGSLSKAERTTNAKRAAAARWSTLEIHPGNYQLRRGHPVHFDWDRNCFMDCRTEKIVDINKLQCPACELFPTAEGHDACLGTIPGIIAACCGHGYRSECYVKPQHGQILTGIQAFKFLQNAGGAPAYFTHDSIPRCPK
jgi:hypothetical protein